MQTFDSHPLSHLVERRAPLVHRPRRSRILVLALAAATLLLAQRAPARDGIIWDFPQPHPVGEPNVATQIVLRPVTGVYAPAPAPALIAVPAGAKVTISTFASDDAITGVIWFKDGERLPTTAKTLVLDKATTAHSGVYTAQLQREVEPTVLYASATERIRLDVGASKPQKLVNISTRATIDAAQPTLIVGFVVDANPANPRGTSHLLIRAVGPSLAEFGVPHPLAAPKVTLFDAKGNRIAWPEVYIPEWNPYALANVVSPAVGASPLKEGTKDFAILQPLPAGAYTVHVASADGGSGDVVLEIYEVPEEDVPQL